MSSWRITAQGRVQGVGFRPFVYKSALELGLTGYVRNTEQGVQILVQGPDSSLQKFWQRLNLDLPPLAKITNLNKTPEPWQGDLREFNILPSTSSQGHQVLISPDTSVCPECLQEIQDPGNRRYLYPFTNCTNCGPRFTITASIPYDRVQTSMACFAMCTNCSQEYQDPLDRRFHAQPNACPECGPHCWLCSSQGEVLAQRDEALLQAAKQLIQGQILALKGLGGFHLACNAQYPGLVQELRRRKNRWAKPLAIMVPDLQTARLLADLNPQSQNWLQDPCRPIVLAPKNTAFSQLDHLAPDTNLLGLMLPYTPLHHVLLLHYQGLLAEDTPAALVMTSGNPSKEPLCLGNREARSCLGHIADSFLLHNRDILVRCDDSVLAQPGTTSSPILFRRSRGFVPAPVFLAKKGPSVLALGAESKNSICLTKADQAFISQHIGDLQNQETYAFFQQSIDHLQNILQTWPEALVADLHPDYLSSIYAREQNRLPVIRLQHHLAHVHAVLAENQHEGPVLGLALDGTGLGLDQTLWGGEFLYVDNTTGQQTRLGHLKQVPLPGGEAAITEPWRMAQSYLYALNAKEPVQRKWPWLPELEQTSQVVARMLDKGLNSPLTSSCGRLFDAVAGLLGLSKRVQYEGQAAIILESIQDYSQTTPYSCGFRKKQNVFELDTLGLFAQVHAHWQEKVPAGQISRSFHLGLAQGLADLALRLSQELQIGTVALSGGVMQNLTLFQELVPALQNRGLHPLLHKYCPPNDACISLGQAAWARTALAMY
ncbi:MAG: carbamoyltransferase HypF [Desulfohalobiaceae bacterium]